MPICYLRCHYKSLRAEIKSQICAQDTTTHRRLGNPWREETFDLLRAAKNQCNWQSYWPTTPDPVAELLPGSTYDVNLAVHQPSAVDKRLSCPLQPKYRCCLFKPLANPTTQSHTRASRSEGRRDRLACLAPGLAWADDQAASSPWQLQTQARQILQEWCKCEK